MEPLKDNIHEAKTKLSQLIQFALNGMIFLAASREPNRC
jgi:hypothetical protein